MPWTNYHSHTRFDDGVQDPTDYLASAKEKGLVAYGFSGHSPVPFPSHWAIREEEIDQYCAEVNALKDNGEVQIYLGLEVDFIPGFMGPNHPNVKRLSLDYTIGSVHFVDRLPDGTPCEIDGPYKLFHELCFGTFKGDLRATLERYFELTRQMVKEDCPDVVGHIDKIKMQNRRETTWSESADWYQKAVFSTLEAVKASGAIMEVNTRGLYKKVAQETYPSSWVLNRAFELGIPVTINSDGHHPREIIGEFDRAVEVVKAAGYQELHALIDHQWQAFPFDQNGIILS